MPQFEGIPSATPERETDSEAYTKLKAELMPHIEKLFETYPAGQARRKNLHQELDAFFQAGYFDPSATEELEACAALEEKNEFVRRLATLIDPLIHFRADHPEEYEKIRVVADEHGGTDGTPINELLAYEIESTGSVRLHVFKNKGKNPLWLRQQMNDGMRKLAEIVRTNNATPGKPPITSIVGSSWIVARIPKVLQQLGFTLEGQIDAETKQAHFADEERLVHSVRMSSEELLKRYG